LLLAQVIDELNALIITAKRRADKRTKFQRAQDRLGRIFYRPAYQHTVTALLVVVSILQFFSFSSRHICRAYLDQAWPCIT
jgi:hypothetical protein